MLTELACRVIEEHVSDLEMDYSPEQIESQLKKIIRQCIQMDDAKIESRMLALLDYRISVSTEELLGDHLEELGHEAARRENG